MPKERAAGFNGFCLLLATCAMLLNQVLLVVLSLPPDSNAAPEMPSQPRISLKPASLAPGFSGCLGHTGTLEPQDSMAWKDLGNPLAKLSPASLRLLPSAEEMPQAGHWLTFGMSSIKRPKASYLEITLSRLFNVLDLEEAATAIIVHLADFDEEWVLQTANKLNEGFTNEVSEGDLHVIHAPRDLYPLKQANLEAFDLSGFKRGDLNARYLRHTDATADRVSYVSANRKYALVWCIQSTKVVHRRWVLVAWQDVEAAQTKGDCKSQARAPEELEVLDESVRGWEEFVDGKWVKATAAKLSNFVNEKGVLLKFGDSPKRTWWRTKQNLDYTFLMWYASNMSDYYMQLEDDIHPVPSFSAFVRSALDRSLTNKPWVMASFSSLGFIGKLFNSSRLPSLAQFLLTYSTEAPCDWLVWIWIDAWSPTPVTWDLPKNLESDWNKKADAMKKGADAVKKLGQMRSELDLYYFNKSLPRVFLVDEVSANSSKPSIEANGAFNARYPRATVESSMKHYQHYLPESAYPPGDPLGFWTADTCSDPLAKGDSDAANKCVGAKFFRLKLAEAFSSNQARIVLRQGRKGHEADFIRHGQLQVSQSSDCSLANSLREISEAEVVWEGKLEGVMCLEIRLSAAQKEWIAIREIVLQSLDDTIPGTEIPSEDVPTEKRGPRYSLEHALLAAVVGFSAGIVAWMAVLISRCTFRTVTEAFGMLSCWTLYYLVALDVLICWFVTAPESVSPSVADRGTGRRASYADISESERPCNSGARQQGIPLDWRSMRSGILHINPEKLKHLGPARDPRSEPQSVKPFLSVGFVLDPASTQLTRSILDGLLDAGAGGAVIGILVAHGSEAHERKMRQEMIQGIRDILQSLGPEKRNLLHLLDPSPELYPEPPARSQNIDLALLVHFLQPLAETFMSLEWGAPMAQNYPNLMQRHARDLESHNIPWVCIHFSRQGHGRKLIRSQLLHRWMEMLLMFPEAPADALYWDFVDVIGNQTVPKATALGSLKGERPDIRNLHAKDKEAILEHLGDVSSLQGKVQRATDAWFKNHPLLDSLFDNPPGSLTTNMEGRPDLLQSLYDDSDLRQKVTCGGHEASSCRDCPKGHGASWCNVDCGWANGACKAVFKTSDVTSPAWEGSWVELAFTEIQDVEAVNVRMGGYVRPPCEKCSKGAEVPDDDFDHALDDAEMLFGRGRGDSTDMSSCSRYTKMTDLAGREVFWRSSFSAPVKDVRCIRIQVTRAQQHPLVFRDLQVRTTKAKQGKAAAKVARSPLQIPAVQSVLRNPAALRGAPQVDGWSEQHLEWVLLTSLAAFAGAFAGVLGSLLKGKTKRRRKVFTG